MRFARTLCLLLISILPTVAGAQSVLIDEIGAWPDYSRNSTIGLCATGGYAYLVMSDGNIGVYNVADETEPDRICDVSAAAQGIYCADGFLYAADLNGLSVLDMSDPASPFSVGNASAQGGVGNSVQVVGDYAYVAVFSYGLNIFNVSTSSSPFRVGILGTASGGGYRLAVAGSYVYLADGTNGLVVIDVSNPGSPSQTGQYRSGSDIRDLYVSGSHAYAVDSSSGNLLVINISNPANPSLVRSVITGGAIASVCGDDSFMFVGDNIGVLKAYSILSPGNPIALGTADVGGDHRQMFMAGVSVFASQGNAWRIIDVSSAVNPVVLSVTETAGAANAVAVSGEHVFLADQAGGLSIVTITNPQNPTQAGVYGSTNWNWVYDVALKGSHALIVDIADGLGVLDVSNPTNPILVGGEMLSRGYRAIDIQGDYAYVAALSTMWVYDISNLTSPNDVGSESTGGGSVDIHVVGNYAYIADGAQGLLVIDVSTPTNPTVVGTYDTQGSANGVFVTNGFAYVADGTNGLQVLNVSVPATPSFHGSINSGYNMSSVCIRGGRAHVATLYNGLVLYDIANPAAPVFEGEVDTDGIGYGVAADANYVYMADGRAGLQIFKVEPAIAPDAQPVARSPLGAVTGTHRPVFEWDEVPRAKFYYLIVQKGGVLITNFWQTGTTWTPPEDLPAESYGWWVTTSNQFGKGPWSDEFLFGIASIAATTIVAPDDARWNPAVWYRWQAEPMTSRYQIWIKRDDVDWSNRWFETGYSTGIVSELIDTHTIGSTYKWWVRGSNEPDGPGPWSGGGTFTLSNTDGDGDGLPDAWEAQHGISAASTAGVHGAQGDIDGDGASNYQELIGDTAASDPGSALKVTAVTEGAATVLVEWEGGVEATQYLEFSTNLTESVWERIQTNDPPTGSGSFTHSGSPGPTRFYRIKAAR